MRMSSLAAAPTPDADRPSRPRPGRTSCPPAVPGTRLRRDDLAAIAQATGVVVETIHRVYGSTAELLKAVVEAAVAGGSARAERPLAQRPAIQAVIAKTNPRRPLELYAATQPGIHARIGPLLCVLAQAAARTRALSGLSTRLDRQRRGDMGRSARLPADRAALWPKPT